MPNLMNEALMKRKMPMAAGGESKAEEKMEMGEYQTILKELGEIKSALMAFMATKAPAPAEEPQPVKTQASAYPS